MDKPRIEQRKYSYHNWHSGFTLVEMVVTIGMFMVLLTILIPSFSSVFGLGAKTGADQIEVSLDKTKNEAMSRLSGKMKLYRKEEEGDFYVDFYYHDGKTEVCGSSEKIGDKKLKITYDTVLGQQTETEDTVGNPIDTEGIILTYNRSSGAFYPLQTPDSLGAREEVTSTKAYFSPVQKSDQDVYVKRITVSRGSRTFRIELYPLTGTYEMIRVD